MSGCNEFCIFSLILLAILHILGRVNLSRVKLLLLIISQYKSYVHLEIILFIIVQEHNTNYTTHKLLRYQFHQSLLLQLSLVTVVLMPFIRFK